MKICSRCNKNKNIDKFATYLYKYKNIKERRYYSYCYECYSKENKEYDKKRPERKHYLVENIKRWNKNNPNYNKNYNRKNNEKRTWHNMIARCYNLMFGSYTFYGGSGITVCDRWRFGENGKSGFECFYEDMGRKPSIEHSIDRYPNNNGNYEKDNCRWATQLEQAYNKTSTVWIEYEGEKLPAMEWSKKLNIPFTTIIYRNKNNIPLDSEVKIIKIKFGEKMYNYNELSEKFKMSINAIRYRLKNNIPLDKEKSK